MNILIACDSFKESLTSNEVASQIEKAFWKLMKVIESRSYQLVMVEKGQ